MYTVELTLEVTPGETQQFMLVACSHEGCFVTAITQIPRGRGTQIGNAAKILIDHGGWHIDLDKPLSLCPAHNPTNQREDQNNARPNETA